MEGQRTRGVAQTDIEATSSLLREVLVELERGLESADGGSRRRASHLVAGLIDHWSRGHSQGSALRLHVERSDDRVQIEATTGESPINEDWRELGNAAGTGVADDWGVAPPQRGGAWFTIRRSAKRLPAFSSLPRREAFARHRSRRESDLASGLN